MERVAVIGGGAFGTAVATIARRAGREVTIWALEPEVVASVNERHENTPYLPGVPLDAGIRATNDYGEALAGADLVMMVPPAQHVRAVSTAVQPMLGGDVPVVVCSKGIEQSTGCLMSEVLNQTLPGHTLGVLSGPMFARDVAVGLPSAATIACEDEVMGTAIVQALGSMVFRPYQTQDLVGSQLGASLKNVIAIAAGICVGREFGESARVALVTRGFAEMLRLGRAMGAESETLMGMSGLGDLMLTCGSTQSRNMTLGAALGKGRTVAEVMAERTSVSEGVHTSTVVVRLAAKLGVDMPISQAVYDVVHGGVSIEQVVMRLMERDFRPESG